MFHTLDSIRRGDGGGSGSGGSGSGGGGGGSGGGGGGAGRPVMARGDSVGTSTTEFTVFHEKQVAALCGRHALNNLVQVRVPAALVIALYV